MASKKTRSGLTWKMLSGYVIVVLLPVLVLCFYFMASLSNQQLEAEGERRQSALIRAAAAFERDLVQIESIQALIRQNSWIMEYLRYPYDNDWEPVYNFVKYIRPNVANCVMLLPLVQQIKLYADPRCMPLGSMFASIATLPVAPADQTDIRSGHPRWEMDENGGMRLYACLVDSNDFSISGILEVTVSGELASGFTGLAAAYNGATVSFTDRNGVAVSGALPGEALATEQQDGFFRARDLLVNRIWLQRVEMWGILVSEARVFSDSFSREFAQILFAVSLLLVALSAFYIFLINRVHKEELLRRGAEYEALQAKIEPHFLYGTLESIRMMAEENGAHGVADIILNYVGMMRYTLAPNPQRVTVGEEVENIRHYLRLQKLRYDDRLDYTILIPDEIAGICCPQFILQPLVENSIKHGLEQRRGTVHIQFKAYYRGGDILLEVVDDGVSMEEARLQSLRKMLETGRPTITTKEGGYALSNINARIREYFGNSSGLTVYNRKEGGMTARIILVKGDGYNESAGS